VGATGNEKSPDKHGSACIACTPVRSAGCKKYADNPALQSKTAFVNRNSAEKHKPVGNGLICFMRELG
tara:strand:+ start:38616 stop:38819 length:204 start_codon:yes stop_codon:yes gene_type:complete